MALAVLAAVGFLAGTGLLVALHALPTGVHPVPGAVSDYGTTREHLLYRAMVVSLGTGGILLALALARATDAHALAWLWVFGISRIAIAAFMTDRGPGAVTAEGRVHLLLAAVAFTSIALAASDVTWPGDPGVLGPLGTAVAVCAGATLLCRAIAPLRPVFGLVERALYAMSIAWMLIAALSLL